MAKGSNNDHRKLSWVVLAAILAFTAFLFSPSLRNGILYGWDDGEYLDDETIRKGTLKAFFTTNYLGMYQPLAVMTLSINYKSAGDNPRPYHATNLFIHLVNAALVYFLFLAISSRIDLSAFVSLVFAIHPMHVEAVAWISTRSNGLYAVFFLAALLCYVMYLKHKSWYHLALTFAFFILSCFSKSMAIMLPVVLLLFDMYFDRKITGKVIAEKIPFFLVSILFGILAIRAASEFGHIKNLNVDYSLFDRLVLIMYSVVFYLVKAIAPNNLSAVYAYPDKAGIFLPWVYYFGVFIFAVVVLNLVIIGKSRRTVFFGMLFFLATLLPVLPLYWSRMFMMADRYTYIPYLGLYFVFAKIYIRYIESSSERVRKYGIFINTALFAYILFFAVSTHQRIKVWSDTFTLVNDVIEKDRSKVDVSIGYFFRGNLRDRSDDLEGALSDFSKAIELNPGYTMAYNNRGIVKGLMKDYPGALEDFNRAITLEPNYADAIYNRGNVNYYLGNFLEACSDWSLADFLGSRQAGVTKQKYCR